MPDLATKESAVVDTTKDDAALPNWAFHSALSLTHLYLLTLYLIPTAQRMTVRYLFLFFSIHQMSHRFFYHALFLGGYCFAQTETRAMGTVQYDGSRPYAFKAKENRFRNRFLSLHIVDIYNGVHILRTRYSISTLISRIPLDVCQASRQCSWCVALR